MNCATNNFSKHTFSDYHILNKVVHFLLKFGIKFLRFVCDRSNKDYNFCLNLLSEKLNSYLHNIKFGGGRHIMLYGKKNNTPSKWVVKY